MITFSEALTTTAPPLFATFPKPQSKEDAPVVDFWCGGGGVGTAGFFEAGFQVGTNIDRDPKNPKLSDAIADYYELNFNKPAVRETLQDYAARGGFKSQPRPDVVVFTQSCKNLSRANQRTNECEVDTEVAIAAAQGLEELLPQVFVLENVREYTKSHCLTIIEDALSRLGYKWVKSVLNSWQYGVAQDRERFILVAVRGEATPSLPLPVVDKPLGWGWACADILHTFPLTEPAPWQLKGLKALNADRLISGAGSNLTNRESNEPAFTVSSSQAANRMRIFLVERAGAKNAIPKTRESDRPSWTIKASVFTDQKGASRSDGLNTWDGEGEWRRVTNRGVARLMGLYDWYQLPEAPSVFGPLLGNGVPSEMARAIAIHIKQCLSKEATMPQIEGKSVYPKEEWINPDLIILDAGTQSRIHEDKSKIDEYKEAMKLGDWDMERRPLPEVMLCADGNYYPIDCHHRVKAAIACFHSSRTMLFLIHEGTLAHARVLSAAANTFNGLGADTSPAGVRRRIEMFLDNIEELSPEAYEKEFLRVPDLTPKEKSYGKFSIRTIARYLRLRSGQERTVATILKERELSVKISHFQIGDRIEVVFPPEIEPPQGWAEGDAGTIQDKDRKVGLWVKWDKLPGAPFPIPPDFVKLSNKPKPQPQLRTATALTPNSVTGGFSEGGSVTFTATATSARVLPDTSRNEDETAHQELTPSPLPTPNLTIVDTQGLKVGEAVQVKNTNSIYHGRKGSITSFPSTGYAIVELHRTEFEVERHERFALSELTLSKSSDLNLNTLLAQVLDNLHLLTQKELKLLEEAIAIQKQKWMEDTAA